MKFKDLVKTKEVAELAEIYTPVYDLRVDDIDEFNYYLDTVYISELFQRIAEEYRGEEPAVLLEAEVSEFLDDKSLLLASGIISSAVNGDIHINDYYSKDHKIALNLAETLKPKSKSKLDEKAPDTWDKYNYMPE